MPPRLCEQALARVDHEHGKVGGRRRRRHIAGVLLVAGRVRNDEGAAVGGEEAPRDIDRDALFALGFQSVEQQREVEIAAGGAVAAGVARERPLMIFEQELCVVEQPADERRLAVVDRTAGEEAQMAAFARRLWLQGPRFLFSASGGAHQK